MGAQPNETPKSYRDTRYDRNHVELSVLAERPQRR